MWLYLSDFGALNLRKDVKAPVGSLGGTQEGMRTTLSKQQARPASTLTIMIVGVSVGMGGGKRRDTSIYILTLTKRSPPLVTLCFQFDHVFPLRNSSLFDTYINLTSFFLGGSSLSCQHHPDFTSYTFRAVTDLVLTLNLTNPPLILNSVLLTSVVKPHI